MYRTNISILITQASLTSAKNISISGKAGIKELRRNYRPLFESGSPLPPHPWVQGLSPELSQEVARRIAIRPQRYPGISVHQEGEEPGQILVDPKVLFAGEMAVRRVASRLGQDPSPWIESIEEQYDRTLTAPMDRFQKEFEFASRE